MTRSRAGVRPAQEVASWAGFCASLRGWLRGLAVPLLLVGLTLWPLLLLAGAIVAAHWAAELACGWEATWLRC